MNENNLGLILDYNYMMADYIGGKGITAQEIESLKEKIRLSHNNMMIKKTNGMMDFRRLPFEQMDLVSEIKEYVNAVKNDIEAFVVLGIGGSALGPIAVQQALNHPYYNELTKEKRNGYPRLYVLDNVDPERISGFLDVVDIEKCLFNVVSKSGSTSETMSQFMILEKMLEEKVGSDKIRGNIVFTTDREKGNLVEIAKKKGYRSFVIPSGVGGRYSELSSVGLLAAAMCGIDIEELLKGAAYMDELCSREDVYQNPAYMFATLHFIAMNQGRNMSVMMPYADSLKYMSDWYAQLWAESIGKKYDLEGKVVHAGQTPVKALGVTDQHSQLQLYSEGPDDKVIITLGVKEYKKELMIPAVYEEIKNISFLGGHTQNELIHIEQASTEYALMRSSKMNMAILFPRVNAFTIGEFIQMMEIATGFMGELMNINAFDQPGVEESKNATYAMFNKPGYESKRREMEEAKQKEERFIIR